MSVIGYYKVFTTDFPLSALDFDAWPGRAERSVQWLFPFSEGTRDLTRIAALSKAGEVSSRLGGAPVAEIKNIREIKNAYAIRVGKERNEA